MVMDMEKINMTYEGANTLDYTDAAREHRRLGIRFYAS